MVFNNELVAIRLLWRDEFRPALDCPVGLRTPMPQMSEDARLEQDVRQLETLVDVCGVCRHPAYHSIFQELARFFA